MTDAQNPENEIVAISPIALFKKEETIARFKEMMGERANAYITNVMAVINGNDNLKKCDANSVYSAVLVAAGMNLSISPQLQLANIIPYGGKAQFQMGYRGFIQLAHNSGVFKTISTCPVYEGQLLDENPLTGNLFDWKGKISDKVIGYASYFSLLNGFEKVIYMTKESIEKHGTRFSKSYTSGPRKTDFDAMAMKTVLKMNLSKYAPLSLDLQRAVIADQAVINDADTMDVEYIDNTPLVESTNTIDPEFLQKRSDDLKSCTTTDEVNQLMKQNKPTDPTILSLFTKRHEELSTNIQD